MNRIQSPNLIVLVNALNDGEYHDGNSLGSTLGMTRSAVWKAIRKLESYGIQLKSDKRKGYALTEPLVLLDPEKINPGLPANSELAVFESVSSTNDYLKATRKPNLTQICLAEQQTAGRGRFNREWVSPFGRNIYLSCLYPFAKDISELAGLSLVVSLAIVSALKEAGAREDLFVKWPNDIVHANKKLSGTLIEVQAESHGACQAIVGVGVNVNMRADESGRITQAWTSMQSILGVYIDRNLFATKLINQLLDYLQRFTREGFTAFVDEWVASDCLVGKDIALKNLNSTLNGRVVGINHQGHLLLQLRDGKEVAVSSGDATILKSS